ncbi:MAG: DEAD/DEAH box helicase family protein [Anaerolineae bacterium]
MHHDPLALNSDPEEFFLLIEANRIRLAHQFDPLLAVSVSQVDPLPHQIEAIYHYALDTPRLRFLIADDPGAGKTIMTGLILKEMQQRGLVRRVLIVAPGHLKYQWQREMKEKFNTTFRLIDRNAFRAAWGENVWEEQENRNIAFAMVILQRRLTSSVHAILSSLQRRRNRLEELLRLPEKIRSDERYDALRTMTEDEIEDLPEEERWEIERRLEHLTIAQNIDDVRAEIEQLEPGQQRHPRGPDFGSAVREVGSNSGGIGHRPRVRHHR